MIERTYDADFITHCVTHPDVWRMAADDGYPDPCLYFPPMADSIYWVRAGDHGVFMAHPHNSITFEVHTLLLPSARGKAVEFAKAAIAWAFANTACERLITNVPSFNPLALRLAKKSGMSEYGVNQKSFKRGGVLYDQILLGISKGGV